jgi:hypothetical protein
MMSISLSVLLILCFAMSVISPWLPESDTTAIKLKGYTLNLQEHDGKCLITYVGQKQKGALVLGIKPPCQFVRDYKTAPLSYTYKDAQYATVLIIVGAIGDPESEDPLMKQQCGTQAQGILIRHEGISASKRIVRGDIWCPAKGADEKEFWMFAHKKGL